MEELQEITRSQLALRNGHDREEIWVCIKGIVYDVTASKLWRGGVHYEHWSGQELDDEIIDAPHKDDIVKRFKPIGRLIGGK